MVRLVACAVVPLAAVTGSAAAGGGLRILDNPALGEFTDIEATGVPVPLGDDGEAMLGIGSIPGNFVLRAGQVAVGLNGGINFGALTVTDLEAVNRGIPSAGAFLGAQACLAFWDDIDDKEGDVYFLDLPGGAGGPRLIVQWNVGNFDGGGATLKFQVKVFENLEPSGIYAQFLYVIEPSGPGAGQSATIGYQDGGEGFGDIQFSFNQAGAVEDGTVLTLFIPEPEDLDGDGRVGVGDLLALLGAWGACPSCDDPASCPADLDGDCSVGLADLLLLLAAWGS